MSTKPINMQVTINKQTKIEEALSLKGYKIEEEKGNELLYNNTQQIAYDLFYHFLITRGTGIQLVVEESPNQVTFIFQESKQGCVTPEGFINQISSSRWGYLVQRHETFEKYLNTQEVNVFGLIVEYKDKRGTRILTRAKLVKQSKNSWL